MSNKPKHILEENTWKYNARLFGQKSDCKQICWST